MRARAVWALVLGGCFSDPGGGVTAAETASASSAGASETSGGPPTGTDTTSTSTATATTTTETSTGAAPTTTATTGSPEGDACDPFAQDCPDGFKCAPYASDGGEVWDANKCVPVTGNDTPGQGCTVEVSGTSGYDSCVLGSMCANVDVDNTGICVSLCGGSAKAPSCSPGLRCLSTNDGVLNQCVEACVPLGEPCSLAAQVCVPDPEDTMFLCVDDAAGGAAFPDESCAYINECGPGLFCGDAAASSLCPADAGGCCLRFCELAAVDACPDPLVCVAYFAAPPAEYADVGFCGSGG